MNKLILTLALLVLTNGPFAAESETIVPAKISRADIGGDIFNRETMTKTTHEDGHTTLDVTSLMSSDKKFASGMYQSGKTRSEITEPYGVDEFMYFTQGSVTLTAAYKLLKQARPLPFQRSGRESGKQTATQNSG